MKNLKSIKKYVLYTTLTFLSFAFISTNYSCEDSSTCDAAVQYSDLLTSLIDITSGVINIGDDIVIANQITNVGITNACDILSETAPESVYSLDFDYRPDANSSWTSSAARALISTDALIANASTVENFNFVFQQGGQYRISGKADAQNDVTERNENNNGNEFLQARNITSNLIINVNKSFNKESRVNVNEPILKVDYSKNPNLISFESLTIEEVLKN